MNDYLWRPHIRLYTCEELCTLFSRAGFDKVKAFYFDNGNVYRGIKVAFIGGSRAAAGFLPYMRSHVSVVAKKIGPPSEKALSALKQTISNYGLEGDTPFCFKEGVKAN